MKKSIQRILMALFGGALLIGSLSACAHRAGGPGANHSAEDVAKFRTKMIDRVSSTLDLNADQKTRLGTLADKINEGRVAMQGGAQSGAQGVASDPRAQMQALITGDKFDRTKAQSLVADKVSTITSKSPELIAAFGDFYDSLNSTQQQKVRDFMQRGRGRGRG